MWNSISMVKHSQKNSCRFLRSRAKRIVACCLGQTAIAALLSPLVGAAESKPFNKIVAPALKQHCLRCHGADGELEGDLNLLKVRDVDDLKKNAKLARSMIDALDLKEMPPEDEPQLEPHLRKQLVTELRSILRSSLAENRVFAHTPLRRMNRFQYNNAVIDLFDLNCVVFTLPERIMREHGNYFRPSTGKMPGQVSVGSRPLGKSQLIERRLAGVTAFPRDLRAENGFDNRGDHLSLSPLLLESFLSLGRSIVESPDFGPKTCGVWASFFAKPPTSENAESAVRSRLQRFLTRAFRRPVDDKLVDRYANYVLARMRAGETFTGSMKAAAAAAIASPRFLYLYVKAGESQIAEPLDDFELASRLSFFLWGSIPDQELLDLASKGRLSDSETLSSQVDRMLDDRRLKRFCDSFPAQWLQLDRIVSSIPDRSQFPDFYYHKYRTSMHMMLEPLLVFETILIEDRSILQLVDSDFSYRSARLSKLYYGGSQGGNMTQVTAVPFKRVKITDRRQGGVITNAAVMTMTSGPERTKPITRGSWLATVIFNSPPEPPPADAPQLAEKPVGEEAQLTLRERLAAHREQADCAGCHEKIDPLGFALENYGPTGKWRDVYKNGREVDMKGTLFRTHKFKSIVEFKDAILAEKDRFTRAFATHLLSFALAREIGVADSLAVDQIASETAASDYRIQTLIKQVVLSDPFLSKSNSKIAARESVEDTQTSPGAN